MRDLDLPFDFGRPAPTGRRTRDSGSVIAEPEERTAELIERLARQSTHVLVKKLATNDRQWAIWDDELGRYRSKQAGPLLPAIARTSGFFPTLTPDRRKPANRKADVPMYWPVTGRLYKSKLTWWSGKGDAENHLTINPRCE